jgi:hypothetical protein
MICAKCGRGMSKKCWYRVQCSSARCFSFDRFREYHPPQLPICRIAGNPFNNVFHPNMPGERTVVWLTTGPRISTPLR